MPYILKGHVPYVKKVVEPVVAKPARQWTSHKPNLDMYISHGFTTDKIMSLTGLSRVEVNARKGRMRDRGLIT